MTKLTVLDLFSGIGGFSLGLERTGGFKTVAFCEINPFCRQVLKKHWPDVPCYEDVKALTLAAGFADVVCGGFPCQDLSIAGAQAGIDAPRSGLWSELVRLIGEVRPSYAIVENVTNLLSGPSEQPGQWFARVLGDLAEIGYDAEWHCIPASALGAPHIRDRVWIIAHPQYPDAYDTGSHRAERDLRATEPGDEQGGQPRSLGEVLAHADQTGLEGRDGSIVCERPQERPTGTRGSRRLWRGWEPEPDVGRVAHGVPSRVDRLRSLGNAVVPVIPELIGHAILAAHANGPRGAA